MVFHFHQHGRQGLIIFECVACVSFTVGWPRCVLGGQRSCLWENANVCCATVVWPLDRTGVGTSLRACSTLHVCLSRSPFSVKPRGRVRSQRC